MSHPAVVDTTIWSNFAHTGMPRLPSLAFPSAASPPAVFEELRRGYQLGYLPVADWSFVDELRLAQAETARSRELRARLGAGEAECLAVAESRDWLVLTDDRAARKLASLLGLRVSGTLGVLTRLVDISVIALGEGDDLLAKMVAAGYRSPVTSLTELLSS